MTAPSLISTLQPCSDHGYGQFESLPQIDFSLTPGPDSGILESLRGVAPGVCVQGPPATGLRRWGDMSSLGLGWWIAHRGPLEQATGCWARFHLTRVQQGQSPSGASPRSSHPNRFVWTWVEIGPVRVWHGQIRLFWREFGWKWLHGGPGQAGFLRG